MNTDNNNSLSLWERAGVRVSDWPALSTDKPMPDTLHYQRAVWGKAHAAASDYRWLACSEGFKPGDSLAKNLLLGNESQPCRLYFWRPFGQGYVAGVAYPSQAKDASARQGFIEKQILVFDNPAQRPAAECALLLLPMLAGWHDDIWWDRRNEVDWAKPDSMLRINAGSVSIENPQKALRETVKKALQTLRHHDPNNVERFYAECLSRQRPACLRGVQEPLPPEALAVLLLALDREKADTLSMAGWMPTHEKDADKFNNWDMVCLPGALPARATARHSSVITQAETMARALFQNNPSLLASAKVENYSAPLRETAAAMDSSKPIRPGARYPLQAPTKAMRGYRLLTLAHEFASAYDRRWLAPQAIKPDLRESYLPESPEAELLYGWVEYLDQNKPWYAEGWDVKVDQLRALALVLVPHKTTLDRIGLPKSNLIPPSLYAGLVDEPAVWFQGAKQSPPK